MPFCLLCSTGGRTTTSQTTEKTRQAYSGTRYDCSPSSRRHATDNPSLRFAQRTKARPISPTSLRTRASPPFVPRYSPILTPKPRSSVAHWRSAPSLNSTFTLAGSHTRLRTPTAPSNNSGSFHMRRPWPIITASHPSAPSALGPSTRVFSSAAKAVEGERQSR
ncbi:uncharacterized protein CC84DRAFT_1229137 [Paraphaeosphaeria sporulosa]|uniref:Uncharacterized protein n=1 Tax=Paraphaeosphaeria sporulosa TaxID=1460663 RepID=A0A177C4J7_9PLEO|nr:uncharacterized protein CC84DRAFT_1229137 [Paraphaeosphaeria sporulosa]OAG01809.1 hypothetical protein CC84DRAFT_1229137 [Paraphaeosphaeria sporulosa]